jgi:cysteine desulfurase/selenocysteine lyase
VSVLHVSNLSGVVFPVKEICRAAREKGALVLVDAAQSVMTERIDVREWGADFVVFSGHKAMGPTGTGILYARREILLSSECPRPGGETVLDSTYEDFTAAAPPDRFEAGLQDYAGAIGCARALTYIGDLGQRAIKIHVTDLNRRLTEGVLSMKGARLIGPEDPALRGAILNASFEGMPSRDLAAILNETSSIMVRAGKHCVNPWFNARGVPESLRISLGPYNTLEEVEIFLRVLYTVLKNFS